MTSSVCNVNICTLLAERRSTGLASSNALSHERMTGILVTVFHLLVMVSIHLAGVENPVKFKEV